MSYFKTVEKMAAEVQKWDNLSPEERKKETAAQIARDVAKIKEQQKAEEEAIIRRQEAVANVKSRAAVFRGLIDKAYDDKDTVRYVYGVAALIIINNLEKGIEGMATDDILSVIPESIPAEIGLEEMEYLKGICLRFRGNAPIDIPLHEDVNITNYTLSDLIGSAVRCLKKPADDIFDLF